MQTLGESPPAENRRWHPRLHKSIILAECNVAVAEASRPPETFGTDACAFGRWLMELENSGQEHNRATELHRRFHLAAAHILEIARSGRQLEALQLLSAEGEYAGIYSELMMEMQGWKKQQFPCYVPLRL